MNEPKSLRDPHLLKLRLGRIHEPNVEPLTCFVEQLRANKLGQKNVPYFDPDGGGINARVLLLFEAPGARSTGAEGIRGSEKGSGIISPDNNDETAKNVFLLREEAGLDRRDLVHWNIVPWYIGDENKIREATTADIEEALPYLKELLSLLPKLEVVLLMGKKAQEGWLKFTENESNNLMRETESVDASDLGTCSLRRVSTLGTRT